MHLCWCKEYKQTLSAVRSADFAIALSLFVLFVCLFSHIHFFYRSAMTMWLKVLQSFLYDQCSVDSIFRLFLNYDTQSSRLCIVFRLNHCIYLVRLVVWIILIVSEWIFFLQIQTLEKLKLENINAAIWLWKCYKINQILIKFEILSNDTWSLFVLYINLIKIDVFTKNREQVTTDDTFNLLQCWNKSVCAPRFDV